MFVIICSSFFFTNPLPPSLYQKRPWHPKTRLVKMITNALHLSRWISLFLFTQGNVVGDILIYCPLGNAGDILFCGATWLEIFSSVKQYCWRYSLLWGNVVWDIHWAHVFTSPGPPCMGRVNNPANVHTYLVCITLSHGANQGTNQYSFRVYIHLADSAWIKGEERR